MLRLALLVTIIWIIEDIIWQHEHFPKKGKKRQMLFAPGCLQSPMMWVQTETPSRKHTIIKHEQQSVSAETCRWTVVGLSYHPALFLEWIHSRCHSESYSRSEDHIHEHGGVGTSPPPCLCSGRVPSSCHTIAPKHNRVPGENPHSNQAAGWWALLWRSGKKSKGTVRNSEYSCLGFLDVKHTNGLQQWLNQTPGLKYQQKQSYWKVNSTILLWCWSPNEDLRSK